MSRDRGRVFDEIADGTITIEKIESSDFYNKIEQRVVYLPLLEQMIDNNDTVFKYNKKANMYSMIGLIILWKTNMENRNLFCFYLNDEGDNYFCRSFFPEEKMDYSKIKHRGHFFIRKKIDLSNQNRQFFTTELNRFLHKPFGLTIQMAIFTILGNGCRKKVRTLKIKKVDDKPMVIHTKEKAKIHAHEPKGAKIKGSNIYTVERGPKTIGVKVSDDKKKSYRKSTIHQSEPKNKGLSRFKRNYRESNTSIKTKNTNLHIAGRTGALAAGTGFYRQSMQKKNTQYIHMDTFQVSNEKCQ